MGLLMEHMVLNTMFTLSAATFSGYPMQYMAKEGSLERALEQYFKHFYKMHECPREALRVDSSKMIAPSRVFASTESSKDQSARRNQY